MYTYQTHYPQQTVYRYPTTFTPTYHTGGSLYPAGGRTASLHDVPQPHLAKDLLIGSVPPAVYPMEEKRYVLSEPPPAYNFSEPYGPGYATQDPGYGDYYGYQTKTNGVVSQMSYTQSLSDRTSVSSLSPAAFETGLSLQSPTGMAGGRKRALSASAADGKRMNLAATMLPGLSDLEPKVEDRCIWCIVCLL